MSEINEIVNESKLKKEILWVVHAFNHENDFTFCLIGISFLEACLKDFLLKKFIKSSVSEALLDHNGALGSASAKAQLAYTMQYIDKNEYQDIKKLLEIRNEFAHVHIQRDFGYKGIENKCNELHLSSLLPSDQMNENTKEVIDRLLKSHKLRFSMSVVAICNKLLYENNNNA